MNVNEAVKSLKKENNGVLLKYYCDYYLKLNGKENKHLRELKQEILDRMSVF